MGCEGSERERRERESVLTQSSYTEPMCIAARIFAMREEAASLSLTESREMLLLGERAGEALRSELEAEAVLAVDAGAWLDEPLAAVPAWEAGTARALAPLTLRRTSMATPAPLCTDEWARMPVIRSCG